MMRRSVVAMVVAASLASACSGGTSLDRAGAGDGPGGDPNDAALPRLSIQQEQVPADFQVLLYPNGDQVVNEVTLDLCRGRFPSESLRIARRQTAVLDRDDRLVFSTEAVGYENEAATAQAFRELRAAQTDCPADFLASPAGGVPVRTLFNPTPDEGWAPPPAGIERLVFDMFLVDEQSRAARTAAVYLRRGRILLGLYYYLLPTEPLPSVGGETTVEGITEVFAARLRELSDKVVKG